MEKVDHFTPAWVYGYLLNEIGISTPSEITDEIKESLISIGVDCFKNGFMGGSFRGKSQTANDFDGLGYAKQRWSDFVGDLTHERKKICDNKQYVDIEASLANAPKSLRLFLDSNKNDEASKKRGRPENVNLEQQKGDSRKKVVEEAQKDQEEAVEVIPKKRGRPKAVTAVAAAEVSLDEKKPVKSSQKHRKIASAAPSAPELKSSALVGPVFSNALSPIQHRLVSLTRQLDISELSDSKPPTTMYCFNSVIEKIDGTEMKIQNVPSDILCELYPQDAVKLIWNFHNETFKNVEVTPHRLWIYICDVQFEDDLSFRVGAYGYPNAFIAPKRYTTWHDFCEDWSDRTFWTKKELWCMMLETGARYSKENFSSIRNHTDEIKYNVGEFQITLLTNEFRNWLQKVKENRFDLSLQSANTMFFSVCAAWSKVRKGCEIEAIMQDINNGNQVKIANYEHFVQMSLWLNKLERMYFLNHWSIGRAPPIEGVYHRSIPAIRAPGVIVGYQLDETNVYQFVRQRSEPKIVALLPEEVEQLHTLSGFLSDTSFMLNVISRSTSGIVSLAYNKLSDRWFLTLNFGNGRTRTTMGSVTFIMQEFLMGFHPRISDQGELIGTYECKNEMIYLPTNDPTKFLPRYTADRIITGYCVKDYEKSDAFYQGYYASLSSAQFVTEYHQLTFNDENPGCAAGINCLCHSSFFSDELNPRLFRTIYYCNGFGHDEKRPCEKINACNSFVMDDIRHLLSSNGLNITDFHYYKIIIDVAGTKKLCLCLAIVNPSKTDYEIIINTMKTYKSGAFIPRFIRCVRVLPAVSDLIEMGLSPISNDSFYEDHLHVYLDGKYADMIGMDQERLARVWNSLGPDNDEIVYGLPCTVVNPQDRRPNIWYHANCLRGLRKVTTETFRQDHHIVYDCKFCFSQLSSTVLSTTGKYQEGPFVDMKPRNFDGFGRVNIIGGFENFDLYCCRVPNNIQDRTTHVLKANGKYLFGNSAFIPQQPNISNLELFEVTRANEHDEPKPSKYVKLNVSLSSKLTVFRYSPRERFYRSTIEQPKKPSAEPQQRPVEPLKSVAVQMSSIQSLSVDSRMLICGLVIYQKDAGQNDIRFTAEDIWSVFKNVRGMMDKSEKRRVFEPAFRMCIHQHLIQDLNLDAYILRLSDETTHHIFSCLQDRPKQMCIQYQDYLSQRRLEEQRLKEEEERQKEEEQRKKEEEQRQKEEQRKKEEQQQEKQRLEQEQQRQKEEEQRLEQEKQRQEQRLEQEKQRLKEEEQRLEQERLKEEQEQERLKEEQEKQQLKEEQEKQLRLSKLAEAAGDRIKSPLKKRQERQSDVFDNLEELVPGIGITDISSQEAQSQEEPPAVINIVERGLYLTGFPKYLAVYSNGEREWIGHQAVPLIYEFELQHYAIMDVLPIGGQTHIECWAKIWWAQPNNRSMTTYAKIDQLANGRESLENWSIKNQDRYFSAIQEFLKTPFQGYDQSVPEFHNLQHFKDYIARQTSSK